MKFRALDSAGDWSFGKGRQSYTTGDRAVNLNVETALKIFRGEVFWRLEFGVDWWNLLGAKNSAASIILQCRELIVSRYGVARINRVSPNLNRTTRNLNVQYDIRTIFSRSVRGAAQLEF